MTRTQTFIPFLLLLFFTLPGKIISQTIQNKKASVKTFPTQVGFTIGNLKGPKINVDSFKAQKVIKMTDDRFSFQSATVYFSGTGFGNVNVATLKDNSLSSLAMLINRCEAGSVVTFDNVKVSGPDGIRTIEGQSFTLYSGKDDTARTQANKQLKELTNKDFVSGTIYFSGASFSNVIIVRTGDKDLFKLCMMRTGPGCIIAYENCIFKNLDGSLTKPLTKTIKLD